MMKFLRVIIFIISVLFLSYIIINSYADIKSSNLIGRKYILFEILGLSLVYVISLYFVASAWRYILILLTGIAITHCFIWLWLKSNIYKYLPGNIFNYVSRQITGKKFGVTHKILVQSNIVEAVLITSTSFILSSVVLTLFYDFNLNKYLFFLNKKFIYAVIVLFSFLILFLGKYYQINIIRYWKVMSYYIVFFVGLGLSSYYIFNYQMDIKISFFLITAIYSCAWLVGFVTPGAPGGMGVRESVFVVLTNGIIGQADAVLLSIVLRFSTIIGEIILFLMASYMLRKESIV